MRLCVWNNCKERGEYYTVKSSIRELSNSPHNEIFPIAHGGVERCYCEPHKLEAEARGFQVTERGLTQ